MTNGNAPAEAFNTCRRVSARLWRTVPSIALAKRDARPFIPAHSVEDARLWRESRKNWVPAFAGDERMLVPPSRRA
jgi:hypothetical protein